MPAKNVVKVYDENGYYHIYNRGVEKRDIFLDSQDYLVFLSYLKSYLSLTVDPKISPSRKLKNYSESVDLLSYCLMPNHFHLLIRQYRRTGIVDFTRSLLTRYSIFFNKKYDRVGGLFQGAYKAVSIVSEEQLVYLSRYIHRNPFPSRCDLEGLVNYPYSSLPNYLAKFRQPWVKHEEISQLFSETLENLTYRSFVFDGEETGSIDELLIDDTDFKV